MSARPLNHPGTDPTRSVWQRAATTYVGLFVFSAVVFGGFEAASSGSIGHGLVRGLVFGFIMSAILGTTVVVGQRGNTGSWSPRSHATITVPGDMTVARRQALIAL